MPIRLRRTKRRPCRRLWFLCRHVATTRTPSATCSDLGRDFLWGWCLLLSKIRNTHMHHHVPNARRPHGPPSGSRMPRVHVDSTRGPTLKSIIAEEEATNAVLERIMGGGRMREPRFLNVPWSRKGTEYATLPGISAFHSQDIPLPVRQILSRPS